MTYFIHQGTIDPDQPFVMVGDEAKHILKLRRVKKKELLNIQDNTHKRYQVQVQSIGRRHINLIPKREVSVTPESFYKITLFQALTKEKAINNIIQKTTELGIAKIVLFHSAYSQCLNDEKAIDKKLARWNKIAVEACKQSDRTFPPKLVFMNDLNDHFGEKKSVLTDNPVLLMAPDGIPLSAIDMKPSYSCSIIIGPEGGWATNEMNTDIITKVSLGPRILRADTAAIVSTGILQFLCGDLK